MSRRYVGSPPAASTGVGDTIIHLDLEVWESSLLLFRITYVLPGKKKKKKSDM